MMMMIVLVFGENSDYGSGDDHSGESPLVMIIVVM